MQEFIQTHIQLSQRDFRELKKLAKQERYPARWLRDQCLNAMAENLTVPDPEEKYRGSVRLSLRFTENQRAALTNYLKPQGRTVAALARHIVAMGEQPTT